MALPNLTRDQAVERAALVTVDNYRITLDLTAGDGKPGERTFRSVTTVEFGPYGATTRSDTTVVWLTAGVGSGRRYISISVNPVTGLSTVGAFTGTAPSGFTLPTS